MEGAVKKTFDNNKIVGKTRIILPATAGQVFKNSMLITLGMMLFNFRATSKIGVVKELLINYAVIFLARMILERSAVRSVAVAMEQDDGVKYNRERARLVLERMDKSRKNTFTLAHMYLKRDVGLALLGTALIPILPMTYTLTKNIPMLHRMYPTETQLQISKRASVPEKQNEKLWSDAIKYLLAQSSVLLILVLVKLMNKTVTVETLKGNKLALVIGLTITVLNSLYYSNTMIERVRQGIMSDVKVEDIIEKEKHRPRMTDRFKAIMKQMKDGFK